MSVSKADYLKKYLAEGEKLKKKKKSKSSKTNAKVKIIDDDGINDYRNSDIEEEILFGGEDAPQVVEMLDEGIQNKPDFVKNTWKTIDKKSQGEKSILEELAAKRLGRLEKGRNDHSPSRKVRLDQTPPRRHRSPKDFSPTRKHRPSHGRDISPKRRDRSSHGRDNSPKRRDRSSHGSDNSRDRSSQRKDNLIDNSPPRRHRSPRDNSPPRKVKQDQTKDHSSRMKMDSPKNPREDLDKSPPRRKKSRFTDYSIPKDVVTDHSPRRRDIDNSPPRKDIPHSQKDSDNSPPRKFKYNSPPRKFKDNSPPRKFKDNSPPRKFRNADISPPRKSKNTDISPPRRPIDTDISPPRKSRNTDISPPRKRRDSSPPPTHKNPFNKDSRMTTTLDGKRSGLQDAKDLKTELKNMKNRENEIFEKMSSEFSGRDAEIQTRKTSRKRNKESPTKLLEKEKRNKENQAKYTRWGKGLKQIEAIEQRVQEINHEAAKPLARYSNDEDLEEMLKQQERAGDPMLQYMRQQKDKKKDVKTLTMPTYKGPYPENRFNIRPGYRWDGLDRSNGYEKKLFDIQNTKRADREDTYKYSTEDM
ncbi:BUD13 family protein [Megaselia abdita]